MTTAVPGNYLEVAPGVELYDEELGAVFVPELHALSHSVPTLYVIAEHRADTAMAFLGRNFPQVKIAVFNGHLMFWEHAERFNTTVDAFLQQL